VAGTLRVNRGYDPFNSSIVQAIEFDLRIAADAPVGLRSCTVSGGQVQNYTMREVLNLVKIELIAPDESGEARVTDFALPSEPGPAVHTDYVGIYGVKVDQTTGALTLSVSGNIYDAIADITEREQADIQQVKVYANGDLKATVPLARVPETATVFRPYAHHQTYSAEISFSSEQSVNTIEILTSQNAARLEGRNSVAIITRRNYAGDPQHTVNGVLTVTTVCPEAGLDPTQTDLVYYYLGDREPDPATDLLLTETEGDSKVFRAEVDDTTYELTIETPNWGIQNPQVIDSYEGVMRITSSTGAMTSYRGIFTETAVDSGRFVLKVTLATDDKGDAYTTAVEDVSSGQAMRDPGEFHPFKIRCQGTTLSSDDTLTIGSRTYRLVDGGDGYYYAGGSPIKVFIVIDEEGDHFIPTLSEVDLKGAKIVARTLDISPDRALQNMKPKVDIEVIGYSWPEDSAFDLPGVGSRQSDYNQQTQCHISAEFLVQGNPGKYPLVIDVKGKESRLPEAFEIVTPRQAGSILPWVLGKSVGEVIRWTDSVFAKLYGNWAHPLEWNEVAFLEMAGLTPFTGETLLQEDRDIADKEFADVADPAQRYKMMANYACRGQILYAARFTSGVAQQYTLSLYRLCRDINPTYFALERGWQIGSDKEMFTEIKSSRLAAAAELILACALIKGTDVALSRAKAYTLPPVGTYTPKMGKLQYR